jgi:putative hydrolase of the HAD superfamily
VNQQQFDAVLFDWGETLFYAADGAEVLIQAGLSPEQARRLWSEIWQTSKSQAALARRRDLSVTVHRAAWEALLAPAEAQVPGVAKLLYDSVIHTDSWLPYPDAPVVLRSLRRAGVATGIVSNVPSPLQPVLERHGLADLVHVFVESYRHGVEKPDPALFLVACEQLGVPPEHVVMVGDSYLTDAGAVQAGLVTLLLPAVAPGAQRGLSSVLKLIGRADTPGGAGDRLR